MFAIFRCGQIVMMLVVAMPVGLMLGGPVFTLAGSMLGWSSAVSGNVVWLNILLSSIALFIFVMMAIGTVILVIGISYRIVVWCTLPSFREMQLFFGFVRSTNEEPRTNIEENSSLR